VSFTPLLLDFLSLWRFEELTGPTELLELDCFAFSLLDEVTSAGSVTLPLLEEDDSTAGSSFCPADADELSSHPTKANAIISMDPIATLQDDRSRNFFINASKRCLSKENVIYFHPQKAKQGQTINTNAARTSRTAKVLAAKNYATVFSSSLPIRRSSSSMSFFLAEEGFFVPFTYAANRG
jgi:hypothetical protein